MGQTEKNSSSSFPWKELFTFLGVIIAAYVGYLGIRSQTEIPIQATQTAEARLTENANVVTMVLLETATIPPSSTQTVIPGITPTLLANSGIEFLNHYYSCINDAKQPADLGNCWKSLSPHLQSLSGTLSDYEKFFFDYRYRYQLFQCSGKYNVGVKYLLYSRPDVNFTTPNGGVNDPTYLRYQVDFLNGQWEIVNGYTNYDKKILDDCDSIPSIDMWTPTQ
jgi:hypothetical protein